MVNTVKVDPVRYKNELEVSNSLLSDLPYPFPELHKMIFLNLILLTAQLPLWLSSFCPPQIVGGKKADSGHSSGWKIVILTSLGLFGTFPR